MSHPVGERLRCEECGAEIVFTSACMCPEQEPKAHSNVCCGKDMRRLGVEKAAGAAPAQARH